MKMKSKVDCSFDALLLCAWLWIVQTFMKPDHINSLEMVLIDEKGGKIYAAVRKQLLYLFQNKFVEEKVYKIAYFFVAPCVGFYRPTLHPHKIVFQMKTKVSECKSSLIDPYGLKFTR